VASMIYFLIVTCMVFFSFGVFLAYTPECKNVSNSYELWNNTLRYEILHTLNLSCSFYIINDIDVILHGLMVEIIYTTVFRVKMLNKIALVIRLFNGLNR
jgi:hypothetical protein